MADIFGGVEPPRWLQAIAKPIDTKETADVFGTLIGGLANAYETAKEKNAKTDNPSKQTSFWEEIPQGFKDASNNLRDPLWKMKVQQGQLGLMQQKVQLDSQQQALTNKITQTANLASDQESWASWLQEHNTLEARKDAEPPAFKTDVYIKAYDGLKLADSRMENDREVMATARLKNQEMSAYLRDLAKIKDPDARDRIRRMSTGQDYGTPAQRDAVADALGQQAAKDAEEKKKGSAIAYPEPTVKDGFLYYRNFSPKKLETQTSEQKARIFEAKAKFSDALRNGDKDAQAAADKELMDIFKSPANSSNSVTTKSGKQFIIEPAQ